MKKIILVGIMLLMFAGVVSASSINGDYEGNPIVKLLNNGVDVKADDVPAVIYNGRTMVPISLLRKFGATVTWDQDNYAVNVKLPTVQSDVDLNSIKLILTQADNFTWSENTAEYMLQFTSYFSTYFNGVSGNLPNRLSSQDIETLYSDVKYTVNRNTDILGSFIKSNPNIDNRAITEQIGLLSSSLATIEKTKNNLLSWEKLRYSDPSLSQSNFDSYISNSGKANSDLNNVISSSHKEYIRLVNLILSF